MDDLLGTLKKFQRTYHQYVKADEKMCASEKPKQYLDSMTAEDYWWNETKDNQVAELKNSLVKSKSNLKIAQDDLHKTTNTFESTLNSMDSIEKTIDSNQEKIIQQQKNLVKSRAINISACISIIPFFLSWIIFKFDIATSILAAILITICVFILSYYILKPFVLMKSDSIDESYRAAIAKKSEELYVQYQGQYPSYSSATECSAFLKEACDHLLSLGANAPMDTAVLNIAQAQAAALRSKELIKEGAEESTTEAKQLVALCTEAKRQAEDQMNAAFKERSADLLNTARAEATATYEQDRATYLELRKQLLEYNVIPSEKDWPNIDLIVDFIQSGRASTLAEALNLCDELTHRESLRQAEAKRLRDQERFHEEQRIRMAELEEEQAREAARNEARHQERLIQEQLNHEEMLRVQEQTRNAQVAAAAAQAAALLQNRKANKDR